MNEDREHKLLEARLRDPASHDEYRAAMQQSVLWLMGEMEEVRSDISAIKERTPTKEELASVKKSIKDDGHWAWLGKGFANGVKVVLTTVALITGISAVYWVAKTHFGGDK